MEKRSTVGSAIGRNRSRNTRISFRNLEGVCVCVHGAARLENMHLHGASASLHAPASSLTLHEFLLAWKISAPLFPKRARIFHPQLAGNNSTQRGTVCRRRRRRRRRKRNLSPSKLVPSLFSSSTFLFDERMISCGVEY